MSKRRKIAIIGFGGITRALLTASCADEPFEIRNILVRRDKLCSDAYRWPGVTLISTADEIDPEVTLVVEAAGHSALQQFGADVCNSGRDLALVSSGALADDELRDSLVARASTSNSDVHVISGAIGALDALLSARAAGAQMVRYTGVKPARAWRGTPAESVVDLENLSEPTSFFTGSAAGAALLYPKNANVAATIALASNGFEATQVVLIADPHTSENTHIVESTGLSGRFRFETSSTPNPANPKTSGSTAFSLLSYLRYGTNMIPLNRLTLATDHRQSR